MGQVIGHSDSHAARPLGTSYRPENLLATILHTLFDVGKLRLEQQVPRESSACRSQQADRQPALNVASPNVAITLRVMSREPFDVKSS